MKLLQWSVEQLEGLQPDLDVLDVGNVHPRDQQHVVADLDQAEHHVVEVGGSVDHDVRAEGTEEVDDADHLLGTDLVGEGGLEGGRKHQQTRALVGHQQALQERCVELLDGTDRVDDGVLGRELEHDGDVAELQVGVDQHHGTLAALGQHHRQVDGDDRLARTTLGGEHRGDPPELARLEHRCRARTLRRRGASPEALGHALHGGLQLVGLDGCGEHVADTRPQRLLQQFGGHLFGEQDRAHLAMGPYQLFHRCQLGTIGTRRAEDGHDRAAEEAAAELGDAAERGGGFSELHRQTVANRLVEVDHCDGNTGGHHGAAPYTLGFGSAEGFSE
jgi:hypothetical protein